MPNELREAAYALGVPKWLTIVKVVLPDLDRRHHHRHHARHRPRDRRDRPAADRRRLHAQPELQPVRGPDADRFRSSSTTSTSNQGTDAQAYLDRAWAGALTLILIVMVLNLIAPPHRQDLRPQDRPLTELRKPVSKRIEVNDLNVYYSKFLAVEGVTLDIEPRSVTAFIGPSGCGKSTFLRTLNRMHEVIPGARVEGEVLHRRQQPVRRRASTRCSCAARSGMVFQRPNPFPTMSIRENVLAGVKLNNRRMSKSDADDLVEKSLRGANLWNEVKDRLDKPGFGPLRRPAAAPVHRPRDRGAPEVHPDGRAVLGPRPDLDPARSRT